MKLSQSLRELVTTANLPAFAKPIYTIVPPIAVGENGLLKIGGKEYPVKVIDSGWPYLKVKVVVKE